MGRETDPEPTFLFKPLFQEYDVEFYNGNQPPLRTYPVPGGGQMFGQYLLSQHAVEVDAFVSVQKMKNHGFMGVTLCLKNLFGLPPMEPHGRSRAYFHHFIRLPYVLADLGRIFNPALNIVDALVAQAGHEWGDGPGRITDTLLAGDQVVATDACGAYLMGHDPQSDWPTPPFHRDRNALLAAAEGGLGTVDLSEIDFQSEVQPPLAEFYVVQTDPPGTVAKWRRTAAEQALYYRDHRPEFVDRYAGQYILLQDFEVRYHSQDSDLRESRRQWSGARPDLGMWFKYVDPEEAEGEHYEAYERALAHIEALKL